VLPRGTMRDIVVSYLPHWELTRLWVLARPLSGFAETFSQYLVEVLPTGGQRPAGERCRGRGVLFVVDGAMDLTVDGSPHRLEARRLRLPPPGQAWTAHNAGPEPLRFTGSARRTSRSTAWTCRRPS
jgi:(S)-ureidoglycine aminohydrolase